MTKPGPIASILILVILLAIPQLIGYMGASLTLMSVETWYAGLTKPALNPPNWMFAVVWTALYFVMGLASWLIWRAAGGFLRAPLAFLVYFGQLFLNLAWSYFFFGRQEPLPALIDLALLIAAVAVVTVLFWQKSRTAGMLMVPYLLWVLFAAYLNAAILTLNG